MPNHAYHCLTGPTLKTTIGYVVDLPATSIVQSNQFCLIFFLLNNLLIWLHCCSFAGNKNYVLCLISLTVSIMNYFDVYRMRGASLFRNNSTNSYQSAKERTKYLKSVSPCFILSACSNFHWCRNDASPYVPSPDVFSERWAMFGAGYTAAPYSHCEPFRLPCEIYI